MKKLLLIGMILLASWTYAQQIIFGKITDVDNQPVPGVIISIDEINAQTTSKNNGSYQLTNIENGTYTIFFEFMNGDFSSESITVDGRDIQFDFKAPETTMLNTVEVFGDRNKSQRKIEQITRFPVSINDQIQSISIVSEKLIEDQGALSIIDGVKNVAGVTQFASYGGARESDRKSTRLNSSHVRISYAV